MRKCLLSVFTILFYVFSTLANSSSPYVGSFFESNISDQAIDPDGDDIFFNIVTGPEWLSMNSDGYIYGIPEESDVGYNEWVIKATDTDGAFTTTTMALSVLEAIEKNYTLIENTKTSPALRILIFDDGSIRQLEDGTTTATVQPRKFAVISKTGLQMESIDSSEIENAEIHSRQWQLPKNGSLLIRQYEEIDGRPDFDNPKLYAITATSDTLFTIQWIRSDFNPYNIPSTTIEEIEE